MAWQRQFQGYASDGATPVLNNYIPVLKHDVFFASLWLCGAGFLLAVVRGLIPTWPERVFAEPLRFGAFLGAVAGFLSLIAFYWSWAMVDRAGGHRRQAEP